MNFLKRHALSIYAVLITIVLIFDSWIRVYGNSTGLIQGVVTNAVYGLFIFLLVKFVPNNREKRIIEILQKLENSEEFSYAQRIQKSRETFVSKYPLLSNLWDSFISERLKEIESGCDGMIEFLSETQRDSFIDKIFTHLRAIPDIKLINSMTWDGDGYFTDYWRSIGNSSSFRSRNRIAQDLNIQVRRLYVFKKNNIDDEKKRLYNSLYQQNKETPNTHMRWIYEEDMLPTHLQSYGHERSSFLLLDDSKGHTKVVTRNFQIQRLEKNRPSYAQFFNDGHLRLEPSTIFDSIYDYANDSPIN